MWLRKKKTERLIKARITGEITPEEEIELNRLLDCSESGHVDLLRLLELEKQLENQRLDDKPIDVSAIVMRKIIADQNSLKPALSGAVLKEYFFDPFPVRFVMILLIGIILGSAITWTLVPRDTVTNDELLSGSLYSTTQQGISFSGENSSIKLIPYQIGNMHFLNFIVDSEGEVFFEVAFDETIIKIAKASYISSEGSESVSFDPGRVNFSTSGKTSFQIVLEKLNIPQASISFTAKQNQATLISKELFFD